MVLVGDVWLKVGWGLAVRNTGAIRFVLHDDIGELNLMRSDDIASRSVECLNVCEERESPGFIPAEIQLV